MADSPHIACVQVKPDNTLTWTIFFLSCKVTCTHDLTVVYWMNKMIFWSTTRSFGDCTGLGEMIFDETYPRCRIMFEHWSNTLVTIIVLYKYKHLTICKALQYFVLHLVFYDLIKLKSPKDTMALGIIKTSIWQVCWIIFLMTIKLSIVLFEKLRSKLTVPLISYVWIAHSETKFLLDLPMDKSKPLNDTGGQGLGCVITLLIIASLMFQEFWG